MVQIAKFLMRFPDTEKLRGRHYGVKRDLGLARSFLLKAKELGSLRAIHALYRLETREKNIAKPFVG